MLMGSLVRSLFVVVSAVTAATLIDPLLEMLSNAGVFGAGSFTDHSTADVAPTFVVAALLAIMFVVLSARRAWLRRSIAHLEPRTIFRLLPAILIAQLCVVFTMETCEQWFVYGHGLGGAIWLGAPAVIALAVHFVGGAAIAVVLARLLGALAAHVAHAVRSISVFFARRQPNVPARCKRALDASFVRVVAPILRKLAGRAPPIPSVV